jgi:dipeptidase E
LLSIVAAVFIILARHFSLGFVVMDLLLLSNSRSSDGSYLVHAIAEIAAIAAGRKRALFVPFAAVTVSWEAYTEQVQAVFAKAAVAIQSVSAVPDPLDAVTAAEMVVIGGGNTFQLLRECRRRGLLEPIAARVRDGMPFIGWSAGANLACPSICTTNDMPIVDPKGFDALGLIEFQINPHFTNALPAGHQGETREQRIAEYIKTNPQRTVVGLPEGDWLRVTNEATVLGGPHAAPVFRAGQPTAMLVPGQALGSESENPALLAAAGIGQRIA